MTTTPTTTPTMSFADRMERFLLSLPTNPYPVSREEMQEMLHLIRRLGKRRELAGAAIAQQVGLIVTWVLGAKQARSVGEDAVKAGAITREEQQSFNLGVIAAAFFPPPPGRAPVPLKDLERWASRALGFSTPRWTRR